MSHSIHKNAKGQIMASVSAVPNITKDFFKEDLDGYEDWICRTVHGMDKSHCCVKAGRDYYAGCADLGNDIHSLREAFLRGERFSEGVPEYQAKVFEPVARFYKESGYKPLMLEDGSLGVELKMTGKEFGGTLDGAGTFSVPFWEKRRKTFWEPEGLKFPLPNVNSVFIEDLKIKSKIDILHPLQLFGYASLLKEVYGIDAEYGLIVRREKNLTKTPEIQLKGYYLPAFKTQWEASMTMWRFLNA